MPSQDLFRRSALGKPPSKPQIDGQGSESLNQEVMNSSTRNIPNTFMDLLEIRGSSVVAEQRRWRYEGRNQRLAKANLPSGLSRPELSTPHRSFAGCLLLRPSHTRIFHSRNRAYVHSFPMDFVHCLSQVRNSIASEQIEPGICSEKTPPQGPEGLFASASVSIRAIIPCPPF
jgi:hypothetical protein